MKKEKDKENEELGPIVFQTSGSPKALGKCELRRIEGGLESFRFDDKFYLASNLRLQLDKGHIRLLTLEPGASDETIHCSLRTTELPARVRSDPPVVHPRLQATDLPEYTALSYQWGPKGSKSVLILCNDVPFFVTRNLHAALLHLRDRQRQQTLWIDSICINQKDKKEKTQQVRRMAEIYLFAASTIAWLGEGSFLCREGFRSLRSFAQASHETLQSSGGDSQEQPGYLSVSNVRRRLGPMVPSGCMWMWKLATVHSILRLEYFTRMWIIQEICLSKSVIFACGSERMRLADFIDGSAAILVTDVGDSPTRNLAHILEARSLLPWWRSGGADDLSYKVGHFERLKAWGRSDLLTLLVSFRGSCAGVQQDNIFALLGLSTEIHGEGNFGINVDYSMAEAELYISAARSMLRVQGDLRIFGAVVASTSGIDLPSWVPEWRKPLRSGRLRILSINSHFRASLNTHYSPPERRETG